ncbi:MAG: hypothetical protein R3211_07715 [Balneolaceae bacterium]|nr:hypothetical protein [Balneolaceae bacterium]
MTSSDYERKLQELVLNWKLRLIVSAMFSLLGLALVISVASGYFVEGFDVLDQTIVGMAVFLVVIPIYLIAADLPKIDKKTILNLLSENVPELSDKDMDTVLVPTSELDGKKLNEREEIEAFLDKDKLYRYLPTRPIKQAVVLMTVCLAITAGMIFVL